MKIKGIIWLDEILEKLIQKHNPSFFRHAI